MTFLEDLKASLGHRAWLPLAIAAGVLVVGTIWLAFRITSDPYEKLFGALNDRDQASTAATLDRLGMPYRIGEDGTLWVPEADVHRVRMRVMEEGTPFTGRLGFELFDNSEMGMTEFEQRVAFQRALEGELTRSIMSLKSVSRARVHLVLPERTVLRGENNGGSASVVLFVKSGHVLGEQEVSGIRRLVAASAPTLAPERVTVVDHNGVALGRAGDADDPSLPASGKLGVKAEIEAYLADKATRALRAALGDDGVLVGVDAEVDFARVTRTIETILPSADGIVRRKETKEPASATGRDKQDRISTEIEYRPGKQVEQIAMTPGAIKRLNVAVVLPSSVAESDVERLKAVAAAVVGIQAERGDTITAAIATVATTEAAPQVTDWSGERGLESAAAISNTASRLDRVETLPVVGGAAILFSAILAWLATRRRERRLSVEQRQRLLRDIRYWMDEERAEPEKLKR